MENMLIQGVASDDHFFDFGKYFSLNHNCVARHIATKDMYHVEDMFEEMKCCLEEYNLYIISVQHTIHKPEWFKVDEKNIFVYKTAETMSFFYEPKKEYRDFLFDILCRHRRKPAEEEASVNLLMPSADGMQLHKTFFKATPLELDKHYNDDFVEEYDKIRNLIIENESGLVLWHGMPGTGKTTALKHLMSLNLGREFIFIPSGYAKTLGEPGFNSLLARNEGTVLIIEDAEALLKQQGDRSAAMSNLLNITDGILREVFKSLIICTFNTDLKNIDEALLRGGRLRSRYEFKKLTAEKTGTEPLTLSELIFGKEEKKNKVIGFKS